ncbi:MAG: F0F1 ATP synthase subunit delta [Clostridia bacterium]|nr:F0F1 ATP synthase subunit delta [Clostridia bacterium]
MTITITVPANITDETYKEICEGFKKRYGNDITFLKETDEKIIGGFIAEANGIVYDTTIRSKLNMVKKVITE